MTEQSEFTKKGYLFFNMFVRDGVLDTAEFDFLMALALKDQKLDNDEQRLLKTMLDKVTPDHINQTVRQKIRAVRKRYKF